jgi:GntR family transcriptional repressor for pyruvate dehydrogenase complex
MCYFANLKSLRHYLDLTQQAFIDRFFTPGPGGRAVSVSRLSLLEGGSTAQLEQALTAFCQGTGVPREALNLPPADFVRNLDSFVARYFPGRGQKPEVRQTEVQQQTESGAVTGPHLEPLLRTNMMDEVVKTLTDYLTASLLSGQLKAGDKLPAERELAKALGIGRSPLREAVKALCAIGFLTAHTGQGTFIATQNSNFFGAPLAWNLLISNHTSREILELRMVLECEAAKAAAARRTEEDCQQLEQVAFRMKESLQKGDAAAFLETDMDFHFAVVRASQNQVTYQLLSTIRRIMGFYSRQGMSTPEQLNAIYDEHMTIYRAVLDKQAAKARRAMQEHINQTNKRYNA